MSATLKYPKDDSHIKDYHMRHDITGEEIIVKWEEIGEWYLKLWNTDRKAAKELGDPNYSGDVCEKIARRICTERSNKSDKKPKKKPDNRVWWQQVLDINGPLNKETIKSQYRKLAKEHHPDVGGSAENFKKIVDAYKEAVRQIS